jgi:uncharacterized membrane protein
MTSLAEPGRQTGWRARLVWIALALSLTLNVFFVGGLVWMKLSAHPPMPPIERMQRIGQALDLNDDQRIALDQFLRVIRLRGRFLRETNQPLLERIWTELAKPTPDDDAVAKLGAEIEQNRTTFSHELTAALMSFVKTLTPEQRAKLAEVTKAAGDPPARRLFEIIAP